MGPFLPRCVCLQIGADICNVPKADAVATGEVNRHNCIVQPAHSPALRRRSARGSGVAQRPLTCEDVLQTHQMPARVISSKGKQATVSLKKHSSLKFVVIFFLKTQISNAVLPWPLFPWLTSDNVPLTHYRVDIFTYSRSLLKINIYF